ncbi:dual specificity protein phosphatase family protein [Aureivirga sp. CE67]|uniref:protein-tyrosine phosphatase family protein n=1 Tax=Aureivirga sp. CE67 TaxID=1788983 RepID=UPI0018CB9969|nr:dual specificity protein phosphatase family protein [Aureivirga sp. CE67]
MISEIYWINDHFIGENKIGIMARPRGNDWLEDEIKWLKIREVDCLVSLLEKSEQWELGLKNEKELCEKNQIEFINFPIKDVSIPDNEKDFIILVKELTNQIRESKKVVIHCRMGIGRSSLLAAAIMINLGMNEKGIFDRIREYRKLEVPDTEEQKNWLLKIKNELKKN